MISVTTVEALLAISWALAMGVRGTLGMLGEGSEGILMDGGY